MSDLQNKINGIAWQLMVVPIIFVVVMYMYMGPLSAIWSNDFVSLHFASFPVDIIEIH